MTGDDPVARLAGRPERVAICLDFDGTIAPIVDDPAVAECGAHLEDKRCAHPPGRRPRALADPMGQAAARIAARHDLEVVPGRMVWELRPQVHSDKGHAARRVVAESGARSLLVAGDDLGDLPAFAVAAELGGGLRVAVRSAEAPARLLEEADLVVDGPEGVRELLEHLLG
jgi:trehalose 6-phosphate phosphatase